MDITYRFPAKYPLQGAAQPATTVTLPGEAVPRKGETVTLFVEEKRGERVVLSGCVRAVERRQESYLGETSEQSVTVYLE